MEWIASFLNEHLTAMLAGLACLGVVVEVTPIKINPVSGLLKWTGKHINAEMVNRVEELKGRINEQEERSREYQKRNMKLHISNFASDLRHNVLKSESQFLTICELCDEYLAHGWNTKVDLDARFILGEYERLGEKVQRGELGLKQKEEERWNRSSDT